MKSPRFYSKPKWTDKLTVSFSHQPPTTTAVVRKGSAIYGKFTKGPGPWKDQHNQTLSIHVDSGALDLVQFLEKELAKTYSAKYQTNQATFEIKQNKDRSYSFLITPTDPNDLPSLTHLRENELQGLKEFITKSYKKFK